MDETLLTLFVVFSDDGACVRGQLVNVFAFIHIHISRLFAVA